MLVSQAANIYSLCCKVPRVAIPGTEFFGHLMLASFSAPRLPIGHNIVYHLETLDFLMLAVAFQSGQHFTQTVLKSSNKKKLLKVHKAIFLYLSFLVRAVKSTLSLVVFMFFVYFFYAVKWENVISRVSFSACIIVLLFLKSQYADLIYMYFMYLLVFSNSSI